MAIPWFIGGWILADCSKVGVVAFVGAKQMRDLNLTALKRTARKGALVGATLMTAALASTGAQAQCVNTFANINLGGFAINPGSFAPASAASVNSLISIINTANTAFLAQTTAFIGTPANTKPGEMGGGIWARGIGGRTDTDATGVATVGGINGNVTCATTSRVDFVGYQAGRDIAKFDWNGWNIHTGGTVGYMQAKAKDVTPGGVASAEAQVPFVGYYAAVTRGGFYADGQVRWDYYNTQFTDPANFITNQNFTAKGLGFTFGTGYYIALPNNWFVEPSAGFVWSKTKVDAIQLPGTLIQGVGLAPPGTVQIDDVESKLGRLSLRAGFNTTAGNLALQPFATASVLHEFAKDVTTQYTSCIAALVGGACGGAGEFRATLTTDRIGTYGQFGVGVAGQLINTGWLGYIRGDFRTGEKIEGWSLNGGVRYQFTPENLATPAVGKGPVYKAAPAPAVLAVNWTGLYVGGYVGTLWGKEDFRNFIGLANANGTADMSGFLGGGQAGYNYQIGPWVLGVEVDGGGSNGKGSAACPGGNFAIVSFFFNCVNQVDWLVTAAGRVGYAYERAMFYGKAGGAWVKNEYEVVNNTTGRTLESASDTRGGWMLGTGVEFALNANWSAKGEYDYMDFGTKRITYSGGDFTDLRQRVQVGKVGLNYRFSTR